MNTDIDANLIVLFCAPISKFPTQPKDQSLCRKVNCPHCHKPMWLSAKKEMIKIKAESTNKDIIFACYDCFLEMIENDPLLRKSLKNHIRIDI